MGDKKRNEDAENRIQGKSRSEVRGTRIEGRVGMDGQMHNYGL